MIGKANSPAPAFNSPPTPVPQDIHASIPLSMPSIKTSQLRSKYPESIKNTSEFR
jgi:hypothetical protein